MSLLNDSMASLHARQHENIPLYRPGSGRQKTLFKGMFIVICASVAGYIYSQKAIAPENNSAAGQQLSHNKVRASAFVPMVTSARLEAGDSAVQEANMHVSKQQVTQQERSVATALDVANEHLQNLRLMSPENGNAVTELRWVLSQSPQNTQAMALLEQVQTQYLELMDRTESEVRISQFEQRVASLESEFSFLPKKLALWNDRKINETLNAENKSFASEELASSVIEQGSIEISQSFAQREQALLNEIHLLLSKGEIVVARQRLEIFVSDEARSTQGIEIALADILFTLEDERALDTLSHNAKFAKHYSVAKREQLAGRSATAYLQAQDSKALSYESKALLAGLLQKEGRYEAALPIYQNLAAAEGGWRNWLGLAVCLDSMGELDKAHRAYLKTLSIKGYSTDIRQYIESRIAQMPGDTRSLAGGRGW